MLRKSIIVMALATAFTMNVSAVQIEVPAGQPPMPGADASIPANAYENYRAGSLSNIVVCIQFVYFDRGELMSKLKYIKIILVLLFKAYLVYLWINFVETFTQLLYNIYVLKVYSLDHFGLFLFFLFGNICCILWLILWCKRLPPAFNKPKIYYKIKDWIRSKKQEAPIYKVLFGSLLLLLKLCLVVYILLSVSTVLSIPLINYQSIFKI